MGREEDTTGMRGSDRFITARDVWLMEAARQDRFTSALAELVAAAGPVWRLGDGYGGWVQERIAGALSDAYGPLAEPHREPAPNPSPEDQRHGSQQGDGARRIPLRRLPIVGGLDHRPHQPSLARRHQRHRQLADDVPFVQLI